ncbi:hypothetical protein [Georgenia sp. SUBG003]|uniref:hypothetical protein n=1 Tax=Georgenia sp. SUBG003 TaxID=1497974 RepID=UPI003AB2A66D
MREENSGMATDEHPTRNSRTRRRLRNALLVLILLGGAPTFALTSRLLEISLWFAIPIVGYGIIVVIAAKKLFDGK